MIRLYEAMSSRYSCDKMAVNKKNNMSKCQLVVVVSYRTCDHKILGPNSRVVLVSVISNQ